MRLTKLYQNFFFQTKCRQTADDAVYLHHPDSNPHDRRNHLSVFLSADTQNYEHLSQSKATQVRSVLVSTTLYLNEICESISTDRYLWNLLACDYPDSAAATRRLISMTVLIRHLQT